MTDKEKCAELYIEAFGDDGDFTENLFDMFFDDCYYIKVGSEIAAMLFLLPCELVTLKERHEAKYLFAAATAVKFRGKGYMTELLKKCLAESDDFIFLKPANDGLIKFYAERGFAAVEAVRSFGGDCRIEVGEAFRELSGMSTANGEKYTLMCRETQKNLVWELAFALPMD